MPNVGGGGACRNRLEVCDDSFARYSNDWVRDVEKVAGGPGDFIVAAFNRTCPPSVKTNIQRSSTGARGRARVSVLPARERVVEKSPSDETDDV